MCRAYSKACKSRERIKIITYRHFHPLTYVQIPGIDDLTNVYNARIVADNFCDGSCGPVTWIYPAVAAVDNASLLLSKGEGIQAKQTLSADISPVIER